jgi:hypothetical protein
MISGGEGPESARVPQPMLKLSIEGCFLAVENVVEQILEGGHGCITTDSVSQEALSKPSGEPIEQGISGNQIDHTRFARLALSPHPSDLSSGLRMS